MQMQGRARIRGNSRVLQFRSAILSETWTNWSENWTPHTKPSAVAPGQFNSSACEWNLTRRYRARSLCYSIAVERSGLFPAAVALAGGFSFAILLAQHRLPRELDLVAFAADAFHENLLTLLQLVTHVFNATIRDL